MHCRKRGVLNEENIAWLEQVFRENVGKGKEEFTLDEFKKIVPSKNVTLLSPRDFLLIFLFAGIFCWKGIQNIWQGWQRNCLAGGVYRDNAPVLRPGRWRENIFSFQSLWLKWWVDYSLAEYKYCILSSLLPRKDLFWTKMILPIEQIILYVRYFFRTRELWKIFVSCKSIWPICVYREKCWLIVGMFDFSLPGIFNCVQKKQEGVRFLFSTNDRHPIYLIIHFIY